MDKLHIRLKMAREASGLSQKEICEMVGIHPPTWNKYETGKSGMNTETLFKVCKALDISADWLMGLSNEPQKVKFIGSANPLRSKKENNSDERRNTRTRAKVK